MRVLTDNIFNEAKISYNQKNLLSREKYRCLSKKFLFKRSYRDFTFPKKMNMYQNLGFNKDFKNRDGFYVVFQRKQNKPKRKRSKFIQVFNYTKNISKGIHDMCIGKNTGEYELKKAKYQYVGYLGNIKNR